jgi:hypothetical protein
MGLGDAALPRFYAVRLLRCNSPAFSVPIKCPQGRRRSAPLPSRFLIIWTGPMRHIRRKDSPLGQLCLIVEIVSIARLRK